MAKKHWISVKRGLSEDPKHREQMGMAVWGFLHMIDRADWETGTVYDWRDKDEADDMGLNERTLRDWRQRLAEKGYISCKQNRRGLDIKIYNWINPKDYSGGIINLKGDTTMSPTEIKGDTEVDTQDDTKVRGKNVTPSLDSKVRGQKSKRGASANPQQPPEIALFFQVVKHYPKKFQREIVIEAVQKINTRLGRDAAIEDLQPFFSGWAKVSGNDWSLVWLTDWAVSGFVPNGKAQTPAVPVGVSVAQSWLAKKQQEAQRGGY